MTVMSRSPSLRTGGGWVGVAVGVLSLAAGYGAGFRQGRAKAPSRTAVPPPAAAARAREEPVSLTDLLRPAAIPRSETRNDTANRDDLASPLETFFNDLAYAAGGEGDIKSVFRLNAEEVRTAIERVRALPPGPDRARVEDQLLQRWAQLEPLKAMEWLNQYPEPLRRHDLKQQALLGWAQVEPMQALVYAELNPDGGLPGSRIGDVFQGALQADTATAMIFLQRLDLQKYAGQAQELIWNLYGRDPDAVVSAVEGLPPGPLRQQSIDRIIDHWARYDPAAARTWMDRVVPPEHLLSAQIELGESWARVDPRAASDWFAQLPPEQQNPVILDRIVRRWIEYEPQSGAEWLRTQPVTPLLDNSRSAYIHGLARRNPDIAIQWVQTISDERRRAGTEEHVAWDWYRRDPNAALEYVMGSGMPESKKKQFADRAERDRREREKRQQGGR